MTNYLKNNKDNNKLENNNYKNNKNKNNKNRKNKNNKLDIQKNINLLLEIKNLKKKKKQTQRKNLK